MGLSCPLFLSFSILFFSSPIAFCLSDLQWKPQPISRIATASMRAKVNRVTVVCLAASTQKAATWKTQGMEMEQMDCSCSMSPLARQLLVLICTSTFQVDSAALSELIHSTSAGLSLILKNETKLVPTPTVKAEAGEENSSMLVMACRPKPLSLLEGWGVLASMRTWRLIAQAVRQICWSPLMSNLGFSQFPKRRMRSASETWLQYLLRVRAWSACQKFSSKQNQATQLAPPSRQIVWMVDSYLLIWKHSLDSSSTLRQVTLPFLARRYTTSCCSTSPYSQCPSTSTSQNCLEAGGRIYLSRLALVKSTEAEKSCMAELHTITKLTTCELQSTPVGWNFSSQLAVAQAQSTWVWLRVLLTYMGQLRANPASTPTIFTPSVTTSTFLTQKRAMLMASSVDRPRLAMETF